MPLLVYDCDPAHATGSVSDRPTPTIFRKKFFCPECGAQFSRDVDLGDHLTTEHPVLEPHMFVGGARVSTEWIIRQPIDASALRIMNAAEIWLGADGGELRPVSAEDVGGILASTQDGVLELHLHGRGASPPYDVPSARFGLLDTRTLIVGASPISDRNLRGRGASRRYDIRVLIPQKKEMGHIDEEFVDRLAREDVTVSDVRLFGEALAVGIAAGEYASALADYVYGMLAKDGTGQTTLPFTDSGDKLKRSLSVVGAFVDQQRLAAVVASCIRFNLNDFRGEWTPCGVPMLDRAFLLFRQRAIGPGTDGSTQSLPGGKGDAVPLCPVDKTTKTILDIVENPTLSVSVLRDMIRRKTLSDPDRVKVQVLLAGCGDGVKREDFSDVQYDPVFGAWASGVLGGVR